MLTLILNFMLILSCCIIYNVYVHYKLNAQSQNYVFEFMKRKFEK